MGQRHQIYIVNKTKNEYEAIGAFHHQWCYGITAFTNIFRLASLIKKNKFLNKDWSDYRLSDRREIETVVKATYGVSIDNYVSMVLNEAEYLIENGKIFPDRGDNNDGYSLIVIDNDKKEVRVCFSTSGHIEGSYWDKTKDKAWTPEQYLTQYYTVKELSTPDKNGQTIFESYKDNFLFVESVKNEIKTIDQKELNLILSAQKAERKVQNENSN